MAIVVRQFFAERKRMVELAGRYGLPAIYFRKSSSIKVALCPTGRTSMTSIGARLDKWTTS